MYFKSEKIGLIKKFHLFFIIISYPQKFEDYEEEYKNVDKKENPSDAYLLRREYFLSFAKIIFIAIIGTIIGWAFILLFGKPEEILSNILQILGAIFILHGTLFLRGWEIQTFGGETLFEKMNRWIYRFQISFGTFIIVVALSCGYFSRYS
ncbi:hypothetical protein KJ762_12465 [bacterium]|nr:hypothetical protein [bacterium]MBU1635305.1 hypothetical protein [bacterium]MBU1873312.1 hypothetical protein [bacterium]